MAARKTKPKKIYLIGIKGVGMTMLAQFLREQGNVVMGSDISDSFMTDRVLSKEKIKVFSPFRVSNIPTEVDLIIYSSAFTALNNPELAEVLNHPEKFKDVPVLSYAASLGALFNTYRGVAVCGSHGKTTTSAWLGYVLARSGKNPNVLVGSRVPQFGGSSLKGKSKWFVAEVDEYQNKLKYFSPEGVLLNNIEFDHPDFFKDQASYTKVFQEFVKKIPASGFLVANNRDKEIGKIKKYCRGRLLTYDLAPKEETVPTVTYVAYNKQLKNGYQVFAVNNLGLFKIRLLGDHNILNALAVIAASRELKVPLAKIKKHLAGFKGTERRTQILGRYQGALIIDDYAHHPTEIKATLEGLRAHFPTKKLITLFHPHTYTRTKALFKDFVKSFGSTDELHILDIYGSAREKQGGVSSQELVAAIKQYNQKNNLKQTVKHLTTIKVATNYFKKYLGKGDLLLLMGAGDVFRVATGMLSKNKKYVRQR